MQFSFCHLEISPGFCQLTPESGRALLLSRSGGQPFLMEPQCSAKVGTHLCSRVSSCQGHHCNYCPSQVESQAAKLFPMLACLIIMPHLSLETRQRGLPEISLWKCELCDHLSLTWYPASSRPLRKGSRAGLNVDESRIFRFLQPQLPLKRESLTRSDLWTPECFPRGGGECIYYSFLS